MVLGKEGEDHHQSDHLREDVDEESKVLGSQGAVPIVSASCKLCDRHLDDTSIIISVPVDRFFSLPENRCRGSKIDQCPDRHYHYLKFTLPIQLYCILIDGSVENDSKLLQCIGPAKIKFA